MAQPGQHRSTLAARKRLEQMVPPMEAESDRLLNQLEERMKRLEVDISTTTNKEIIMMVEQQRAILEGLESEELRALRAENEAWRKSSQHQQEYIAELERTVANHNLEAPLGKPPLQEYAVTDCSRPVTQRFFEMFTGFKIESHSPPSSEDAGDTFLLSSTSSPDHRIQFSITLADGVAKYSLHELVLPAVRQIPEYISQDIEFESSQAPIFFFELSKLLIDKPE